MLFNAIYSLNIVAQVTNITAKHDNVNEKYIINYDLSKANDQRYFDIEIIAMIGGIKVRPSMVALSGDFGLNIKYGSKKRIVWDYFIDIEKIIGKITFKVRARKTFIPPPPPPRLDIAVGTVVTGAGIYLTTLGGKTVFKKGKIDPMATADKDPIIYYYTFCDTDSPNYDLSLVQIATEGATSACDVHFTAADKAYKKGVVKSAIGLAIIAGGIYTLVTKPFHQSKLKAYRKKYDLTLQTTLNGIIIYLFDKE